MKLFVELGDDFHVDTDWKFLEEFIFDPESGQAIVECIYKYPIDLKMCAAFISLLAPLCNILSPEGCESVLKEIKHRIETEGTRWIYKS